MRIFSIIIITMLSVLLVSCGATNLKSIKENPSSYVGKELSIKGKVKNVITPALSPVKIYELDDGTDTLFMTSVKSPDYAKDAEVSVKGEIFYLGGDNLTVGLEDLKRGIKKIIVDSKILKDTDAEIPAIIVIEALKLIVTDKTLILILVEKSN